MSSNVVNSSAYLRTSREFPEDLHQLTVECNKSYVDVARAVNARTIGIYSINRPSTTGNVYFVSNQRQQSLRQVYTFGASPTSISLGFKITSIQQFSMTSGVYTDGTSVYGLISGSSVAIAGQNSFYIQSVGSPTSDVITFVAGAGAPTISSGMIILEWIV